MALTQEQIERRFDKLGGSDLARCVTGKFGGEAAVATEKQTRASWPGNDYTEIGDMGEPKILDFVERELGCPLRRNTYREVPGTIIAVNIDAEIDPGPAADYPVAIAEAKVVVREADDEADRYGEPGTDEVPAYVTVQAHAGMLAAGVDTCWVGVWILGKGKRLYCVRRDDELCDNLLRYAEYFNAKYMIRREAPELDEQSYEHAERALSRIQRAPGKALAVTDKTIVKLVDTFDSARTSQSFADTMAGYFRAKVLQIAGDAERLELPDGRIVEIKNVTVNYKARAASTGTQTRVRIIEPKGKALDEYRTANCDS